MPKWQPSRGGEGAVRRVVSAPHAHGQRALSSPRGARRCRVRQGPPGACDGSNCSYLLKSSVPWWPSSRVLPAAFWGRRSVPIVPKGTRRWPSGLRTPAAPALAARACGARPAQGVARQPPWGSSSPGRVELVQPAAAGTRRRTEPLLSGSTSVRTWGLGRRKERFPLGREAFPARVPGLQLAAGDVIPVGKALGVNRVAGTGTAVAGRGRDGSLWVPVR